MDKPCSPEEYVRWWNKNFDIKIDKITEKQYRDAAVLVKHDFEHSAAWQELISELHNYHARYRLRQGYDLLMKKPEDINIDIKEWRNFISKIWRKNVVENENWDGEPDTGWITPDNWFEKINDIVRTTIVVKYFDGVGYLIDNIFELFTRHSYKCVPDWEAREEGYYAAQLYVIRDYELLLGLATQKKQISVEIQVITQMKDVIRELTHKYYEQKRAKVEMPDKKWQWDYSCDEFEPNYIGHILHYIEGAIMKIRDRR